MTCLSQELCAECVGATVELQKQCPVMMVLAMSADN